MGFRATVPAAWLAVGWPTLVLAHGLVVFAAVEGDEVVVEAKFSNGRPMLAGEVRVLDAEGRELLRFDVGPDSLIRIPIGPEAAGGLTVEVSSGDGHENYWILTQQDIAAGQDSGATE